MRPQARALNPSYAVITRFRDEPGSHLAQAFISVSITSPLEKGVVPWPTPPQVPQLKTSPSFEVRMREAYSICSSGVNMNCEVLPFCRTSPLTVRR